MSTPSAKRKQRRQEDEIVVVDNNAMELPESHNMIKPPSELVVVPAAEIITPTSSEVAAITLDNSPLTAQDIADAEAVLTWTPAQLKLQQEIEAQERLELMIREKFEMMDEMVARVLDQECVALIISGAPGIGKTHTVEKQLGVYDPSGVISRVATGSVTPVALLGWLYQHRHEGMVVALDDIDVVFDDVKSLSYLKKACDAFASKRTISAGSSKPMRGEDGKLIDSPFDFEGSVIFITNVPMNVEAANSRTLAKRTMHLNALKDRCECVDLGLYSNKQRATRISMVVDEQGLLDRFQFETKEVDEIMGYFFDNFEKLEAPSLRTLLKIGDKRKKYSSDWVKRSNNLYLMPAYR